MMIENDFKRYNVLFFLTSSKNTEYTSLKAWLKKTSNLEIVKKIKYMLILDSLGNREAIYLNIHDDKSTFQKSLNSKFI